MTPDMIVNYAIYGVVGALALLGMLAGLVRGVMRSLVRLITVSASFGFAFLATMSVKDTIFSYFDGKSIGELLAPAGLSLDGVEWLNDVSAETIKAIIMLPAGIVVLPLVFVALFLVMSFLMILIHKVLSGIMGYTKSNNNELTRLLGAAVGAAQGAVMALVILIPVSGTITMLHQAVDYVAEKYPDRNNSQQLVENYNYYLGAAEENMVLDIVDPIAEALYPSFTVFELDGEEIDTRDTVQNAAIILVNLGDIAVTDWAELNANDKEALDSMVSILSEDKYYATIASGILRAFGEYVQHEDVFGLPEPLKSFVDCIFGILRTSNTENLGGDLNTLKSVLYILSDSGTLRTLVEGGNALEAFISKDSDGQLFYNKFTAEFNKNPRMSLIVTAINTFAFEMLLQNNQSDIPVAEVIDSVKTGINDVLSIDKESYETEEEYRDAVSSGIEETLKNNDIALNEEQMEQITDFVINDMEDVEELTDAEIADFISRYYEIYAGIGNGDSGEIPEIPDGFPEIPGGLPVLP